MTTPEGSARNIVVIPGEPPSLQLPWDEAQMVHDAFRHWGVPVHIGNSFGEARQEFLRRCRIAGITPPQARFGLELNMQAIPPEVIADGLQTYDTQHTELILFARPPYDVNSLDYMKAALERKKVEHAILRFRELGLLPTLEYPAPEAPTAGETL